MVIRPGNATHYCELWFYSSKHQFLNYPNIMWLDSLHVQTINNIKYLNHKYVKLKQKYKIFFESLIQNLSNLQFFGKEMLYNSGSISTCGLPNSLYV